MNWHIYRIQIHVYVLEYIMFWDRISSSQRRNIYKKYGQPVFHISPNVKIIHWALR